MPREFSSGHQQFCCGVCVTRLQPNILRLLLSVVPKSPQQVYRSGDNSAFNGSNNNQKGLDTKRSDGVNWPSGNQALGWYISRHNGVRSESTYWPTTPVSVTVVCLDPVCTDLSALHNQATETYKPGTTTAAVLVVVSHLPPGTSVSVSTFPETTRVSDSKSN